MRNADGDVIALATGLTHSVSRDEFDSKGRYVSLPSQPQPAGSGGKPLPEHLCRSRLENKIELAHEPFDPVLMSNRLVILHALLQVLVSLGLIPAAHLQYLAHQFI